MQKTILVNNKKVKVITRKITRHCNFCGWAVFIEKTKYKFFCLSAQKAIDHAIAKHYHNWEVVWY